MEAGAPRFCDGSDKRMGEKRDSGVKLSSPPPIQSSGSTGAYASSRVAVTPEDVKIRPFAKLNDKENLDDGSIRNQLHQENESPRLAPFGCVLRDGLLHCGTAAADSCQSHC
jgi:hypothetical protein